MPLVSSANRCIRTSPSYSRTSAQDSAARRSLHRSESDSVFVRDAGSEMVVSYNRPSSFVREDRLQVLQDPSASRVSATFTNQLSGMQEDRILVDPSASRLSATYLNQAPMVRGDMVLLDPSASRLSATYTNEIQDGRLLNDPNASRMSATYTNQAPIVVEQDGTIVVEEPGCSGCTDRSGSRLRPGFTCDEPSPASRISRSRVERIVSMPFPNAPARRSEECTRPDERDDIIRELRSSVSRLEKKVHGLETERANLLATLARFKDDNAALQREIARLNKLLEEERAMIQVNLSSEEMKRREAFELVDLQRKLLLMKDEEIRQLSQLAAAHKEQIFILYSHLGSVEINSILDDAFDIRRIDLASLDPDARARIMELLRAPTMEGRFDITVIRPKGQGKGAIYTDSRQHAYDLDAADGVLDGRYGGRNIMVPKRQVKSSGYGRTGKSVYARDKAAAAQLDAADGVVDGRYMGSDILVPKGGRPLGPSTGAVYARDRQMAANLDAADGTIDGRYQGKDIMVAKGGPRGQATGGAVFVDDRSAAARLDAADGVVDGRYQGHNIMVAKGQNRPTGSGGGHVIANDRMAAQALDAQDGVIDGRFQGKDILVPKGRGGR